MHSFMCYLHINKSTPKSPKNKPGYRQIFGKHGFVDFTDVKIHARKKNCGYVCLQFVCAHRPERPDEPQTLSELNL